MRYTQRTQEERYQIYALMKADHDQSEMTMILGRYKSTFIVRSIAILVLGATALSRPSI